MNIGQAAKFSGVSPKMIRYYEQIGLIAKAIRSDAGYRHYSVEDTQSLRFIRRARDLGFSVERISGLLVLWRDGERASADVKAMALTHAAGLRSKIVELQAMAQTLEQLAEHCHGNDRPDCPILADLAHPSAAAPPHRTPKFGRDMPASSRSRAAKVTQS